MAIRSDEITSIIRSEIKGFDEGADVAGVGTIVEVGDGIAQIYGLSGALAVGAARVSAAASWAWPSTWRRRRSAP